MAKKEKVSRGTHQERWFGDVVRTMPLLRGKPKTIALDTTTSKYSYTAANGERRPFDAYADNEAARWLYDNLIETHKAE